MLLEPILVVWGILAIYRLLFPPKPQISRELEAQLRESLREAEEAMAEVDRIKALIEPQNPSKRKNHLRIVK